MTAAEVVERLRAIGTPGVIGVLDPAQASEPDPLGRHAPAKPEGSEGAAKKEEKPEEKKGEPKAAPCGDPHVYLEPEHVRAALEKLRDDPELRFEMLVDVTGIDYKKEAPILGVIYQLLSLSRRRRVTLRADVPKADPTIDTAYPVYPAADWHEREAAEMFGLVFRGHPDPRNLLLAEDWEGHPLRKDYEFPVEYHGISAV
jgi:NADH-quinone oxidoreductase subunit C